MQRPALTVLLILASSLAARAEETPIGWALQRGETIVYRIENTFKFWPAARKDGVDSGGNDPDRVPAGSGKFEEKLWIKLEVEDINADGEATITVSFPRVSAHARMDDTGEEAEWDSKDGKPPQEFGFGPNEFLTKNTWKAKIAVNGELASVEGKTDYLVPGKTRVRKKKGEMSRAENASVLMPMPLPVEFWLEQIFSTIPKDGKASKFNRRLIAMPEISDDYAAEFDSMRDMEKRRCAHYRFEKKDEKVDEKKSSGGEPADFTTGDFREGEGVKRILALSRRTVKSWFAVKDGIMVRVEGEARDDKQQIGTVWRSQDWFCALESRKAAK
jgi:hypothetical protein